VHVMCAVLVVLLFLFFVLYFNLSTVVACWYRVQYCCSKLVLHVSIYCG
jgi:hypothetical protein